mgnify:FL=1
MCQGTKSITSLNWPSFNVYALIKDTFNLPVMINGKLRDVVVVRTDCEQDEALDIAKQSDKVKNFIENKEIKKVIYVKNKILNIII